MTKGPVSTVIRSPARTLPFPTASRRLRGLLS
jgi:hypothetical protein